MGRIGNQYQKETIFDGVPVEADYAVGQPWRKS